MITKDAEPKTVVSLQSLATAVNRVYRAADDASVRYALDCVQIMVDESGEVAACASDGRRLYVDMPAEFSPADAADEIYVSRKDARQLADLQTAGTATIDGMQLRVQIDRTSRRRIKEYSFVGSLQRFPRWIDVIPDDDALMTITGTIAEFTGLFTPDDGIVISGGGKIAAAESRRESVEMNIAGAAAPVKLDPDYALDWLRGMPDSFVADLEIRAKGKPAVFRCEYGQRIALAVIMPLVAQQ